MTKLIPLALAALALTAGAAAAENTFAIDRARTTADTLSLANVQADQAGTIEVYDVEGGAVTRLLGIASVEAGTTGAVDVALDQPSTGRIQVLLSNGNRNVATLNTTAVAG